MQPVVPRPRAPQHVVVVVVDTLRADRCSVQGYGRPTTPALDRVAPESIVYTDYPLDRVSRSLRSVADGRWHYLRDDLGSEWLWDLVDDPGAGTNVAATRPSEVDRLRALLQQAYPDW